MSFSFMPEIVQQKPWLFGGIAATALFGIYFIRLYRKWIAGGVCTSKARLDGKTVIITGANSGIGLETAVDIAKRNARVILACRSVERGKTALADVKKRSGSDNVAFVQLDLGSLDSVRTFAAKILEDEPRIDILINNAGVMMIPKRMLTPDGFEMQFGVNHLGHFLLTNLLLDRIKKSPRARIVNLSSSVQAYMFAGKFNFDNMNSERSYGPAAAYCTSKLANVLFTRSLAKRLEGTGVTTNAVDPGAIKTGLQQHLAFPVNILVYVTCALTGKTPLQGAQTTIYCAVSEEMEGVSGKFVVDCKIKKPNPDALDDEVCERLWKVSTEFVGLN